MSLMKGSVVVAVPVAVVAAVVMGVMVWVLSMWFFTQTVLASGRLRRLPTGYRPDLLEALCAAAGALWGALPLCAAAGALGGALSLCAAAALWAALPLGAAAGALLAAGAAGFFRTRGAIRRWRALQTRSCGAIQNRKRT